MIAAQSLIALFQQALKEKWEDYGFNVISMRDDFRTIYGDGVVKTGEFHWLEDLADTREPAETEEDVVWDEYYNSAAA